QLFLLTSRYEGFGNVLIEAMACGVPVIATASSGTRDIVRDGIDGRLVDVHSPHSIAAAVVEVLTSHPLRASMSIAAKANANRFAADVVVDQYDALLEEIAR